MHRPQTPQPGFGSIYTLLQKFTPHFKILDPRLDSSSIVCLQGIYTNLHKFLSILI